MAAIYPVADLARFLAGPWRIARRVADRRSGTTGRLMGIATFTQASGGLRYDERGTLTCGAFRGEAYRSYWLAVGPGRAEAEVRFDDGRLFHTLDLSAGRAEVEHDCGPDRYHGRYRVGGRDGWTLAWQVRGPRKQMIIATRYVRASPALP